MPWVVADVEGFIKDLSDKQKETWVEVANGALDRCLKAGGKSDVCDASAIKQANTVAGVLKESEETVSLREKIKEALEETEVSEAATLKAMVQSFLRSADGIAAHKGIPAKVKTSIKSLRTLLHQTWGDIEAGGDTDTAGAKGDDSEGSESIGEATFDEGGGVLLANVAQLVENGSMVKQT